MSENNMRAKELTRRNFLLGAAVASTATIGAVALSGCATDSNANSGSVDSGDSSDLVTEGGYGDSQDIFRYSDGWVDTENTAPIEPIEKPRAICERRITTLEPQR